MCDYGMRKLEKSFGKQAEWLILSAHLMENNFQGHDSIGEI